MRTQDLDPSPDHAQAGATCTGLPLNVHINAVYVI
jgi:hypothetical protein